MDQNVPSNASNKAILQPLPLNKMDERHHGLSHALAESYLEAARVSLDRHHASPQEFTLNDDNKESEVLVQWDKSDERTKGAWANNDDATRDGAYACALAATELSRDYFAVKRAEKLTGADYYVAPNGAMVQDLENYYRLEVSGTNLDSSFVRTVLRNKVKQAQDGRSNLPALAAVVGFKARLIIIQTVGLEI